MRYRERYIERRERALRKTINLLLVLLAAALIGLAFKPREAKAEPAQDQAPSVRVIRVEPEAPETAVATASDPAPEEPQTTQEADAPLPDYIPTWDELKRLAKLVYGEARGVESQTEQAAIIWCVLNRIDAGYGNTVTEVVHAAHFHGYKPNHPMVDDFGRDLEELASDVVSRWLCEQMGDADVGRILPQDYLWFTAVDGKNVFRNAYDGGGFWGWNWPSPYES